MANPVKGETPLVLKDGRAFTLVLDHEAMLGIEDRSGKPLHTVMAEAQQGFLTAVAWIVLAAFGRNHPEITRADVLEMLFSDEQETVTEALGKATDAAFPKAKSGAEGNATGTRGGTTSGDNGAKQA